MSASSTGLELRVGNKYRLGRKVGSGSFGDIYLGAGSGSTRGFSRARSCVKVAIVREDDACVVCVCVRARVTDVNVCFGGI